MEERPTILVALKGESRAFADMLGEHPARVLLAYSGIDVVSHLFPRGDSYASPPSIMVLSAILPGYNGLSVLAGIRSFGWRTPVVLTWPSSQHWMAEEAIRLGCSGLFKEPANLEAVATAVLHILDPSLPKTGSPFGYRTLDSAS